MAGSSGGRSGARLAAILWIGAALGVVATRPAPAGTLDVRVTDLDGRPVSGLGFADFRLFQDDVPVSISDLAEGCGAAGQGALSDEARIVLVVERSTASAATMAALDGVAMALLLRQSQWKVPIMVFSLGDSLDLLSELTTDVREPLKAIADLETQLEAGSRQRRVADPGGEELLRSADALTDLVDTLRGLPGRTEILYFGAPSTEDGAAPRLARRLAGLAERANRARVTLHALRLKPSPIERVVEETGGLVIDPAHVEGLLLDLQDGHGVYQLEHDEPFASGELPGRLRLEMRAGLVAHYRAYHAGSAARDRLADRTEAAMHYGTGQNPLEVELLIADESPVSDDTAAIELHIRIPLERLDLALTDRVRGMLRVFLGIRGPVGRPTPIEEVEVPIDLPLDAIDNADQRYFVYPVRVFLPMGRRWLAVGVVDEHAGRASFVRGWADVGS